MPKNHEAGPRQREVPAVAKPDAEERDELVTLAVRAWNECFCQLDEPDPVLQGWRAVVGAVQNASAARLRARLAEVEARLVLTIRILGAQASRAARAESWVRERGPALLSLLDGEPQHSQGLDDLQSAVEELRLMLRQTEHA